MTERTTRRVILVFDALNQFDATDGAHWLNWLPRELPPGVRIVASVVAPAEGQPEHQTLAILRNRPDSRVEKLEPLTEADTHAIIEGYLRRYSKRLSEEQIAALKEKPAGRLPLYVLTALEELRTLGTYAEITARIRELPGDARALFGWILTERLARDPGFRDREGRPCGAPLVTQFAACLGISRHGLSPAELTALLDPGDPLGNVAALLRLLRPYLMRRGELLDFYHGQFREAAGAAHLDTPEKQRTAHQSVATCLQAFADPNRDGQCRDTTPHALSELPHHQTRAEAWPDLVATLENLFFLEAKVTHGMAFDLAEDFTIAVDALPAEHAELQRLRLLDEALRRDIHFVARHAQDYPQGLFQCLWNSAWWYDCPEAAKHYANKRGPPPLAVQSLSDLLQHWRQQKERFSLGFSWLRTLRPPQMHLGTAQQAVLRGHEKWVSSVAFSHDGRRIVSGSEDKTVRIWDAASGAELAVLRGHKEQVNSVAFSPDGRRTVSGSGSASSFGVDITVRVWDAASGAELAVLRGHKARVSSVGYSPDGRRIVSGSEDKTVRLWNPAEGAEVAVLRGHEEAVCCVSYSPGGDRIVSGSRDQTVRVWDATSGAELAVLHGHEGGVTSVGYSPDGRCIVSGSKDHTVRVWDAASGAGLAVLRGHESGVNSVGYSPDGQRIVSGSGALLDSTDNTVRVWDAANGAELAVLRGHESLVTSVSYSPDGRCIVSGSGPGLGATDCTVRVWDAARGAEFAVLHGHEDNVMSVSYAPDGRRVVSGSIDKTVRVWDAGSGAELAVLRGHEGTVLKVDFSINGRNLISVDASAKELLWDAASGRCLSERRVGDRNLRDASEWKPLLRAPKSHEPTCNDWQIAEENGETIINQHPSKEPVARFPDALNHFHIHPDGRAWAGGVGPHLALLRLEGG